MDRRKYLKNLALGTMGTGALLQACGPDGKPTASPSESLNYDRTPEEKAHYDKVMSQTFFTEHEMKTITVLGDLIIPKDDKSGSASDAGVPAFIEFIVKDMQHHQVPMRGGLKWLDIQSNKQFGKAFIDLSGKDQTTLLDQIAYPETAAPEIKQGVAFFNLMRDLTACGFFSSKIGIQDIGYVGNQPNQWDGVPQDVLDQYGLKYDQRTLDISVKFDS